jgi:hypothetical protein
VVHFLGRPQAWHKIDLVRRRDASAPRGWAYEAHLMILGVGYASPATRARRAAAAGLDRVGGIDGNVSNLSVVSLPDTDDPDDGQPAASRVELTAQELAALARAERRTAAGLAEQQVTVPGGARVANAAGAAVAKDHRARRIAAGIVGAHGAHLVVEDCDIRTWFRLWGKRLQATTPGRLTAAIGREAERTGGRLLRASTFATKLSQTCPCGAEVAKTLADRVHDCPACGLTGDRDLVSALLAALVRLTDPDDPATARLDSVLARHTQILFASGLHEALSSQPQRSAHPTRGRTHAAAHHPPGRGAPARRNTTRRHQPTPDETRPATRRHKAHAGETDRAQAPSRKREPVGRHPLMTG